MQLLFLLLLKSLERLASSEHQTTIYSLTRTRHKAETPRRRGGDSRMRTAQGPGQAPAPRRSFRPEARGARPGSAPRRASANPGGRGGVRSDVRQRRPRCRPKSEARPGLPIVSPCGGALRHAAAARRAAVRRGWWLAGVLTAEALERSRGAGVGRGAGRGRRRSRARRGMCGSGRIFGLVFQS